MAERIEVKTIITPAFTTAAAPMVTSLNFRQGYPTQLELRIPPGPSGLVGVALFHSGQQVIPYQSGEWLITDDESVIWPLSNFPYNAKYTVATYNLDVYAHTIQVRMLLNEIGQQAIPAQFVPSFESPAMVIGQPSEGVNLADDHSGS